MILCIIGAIGTIWMVSILLPAATHKASCLPAQGCEEMVIVKILVGNLSVATTTN